MNGLFAVDTNAVVDYLRESRPVPPALLVASEILLPLTVLGELFAGAFASERSAENLKRSLDSQRFGPCSFPTQRRPESTARFVQPTVGNGRHWRNRRETISGSPPRAFSTTSLC